MNKIRKVRQFVNADYAVRGLGRKWCMKEMFKNSYRSWKKKHIVYRFRCGRVDRPKDEDWRRRVRPRLGRHHVPGTAHRVLAPGTTADDEGEEERQDAGDHREDAHQQLGVERGGQDWLRWARACRWSSTVSSATFSGCTVFTILLFFFFFAE